jgi:UDP-N-acetylglucosamine:LPS N-acetylglucosamine transferase
MEEKLVKRENVAFQAIPAAGVHGVGLRSLPGNLYRLVRGTLASHRIVRSFKPDVLLLTGGYVAAPMVLAARNIPTVLFVPDIEPGMALNFLAPFAHRIALTTEDSLAFFPAKKLRRKAQISVTGYPVRPGLVDMNRQAAAKTAKDFFKLEDGLPVLLVTGGSRGTLSINQAILAHLSELLGYCQVIHIIGERDWGLNNKFQTANISLPAHLASRYHAYPYLHEEMAVALACADLVISRAGASILGEYPSIGLPAILVPYPYAWRYQKVNADFLVRHNAAVMLPDSELDTKLLPLIIGLFNQPEKLETMRKAMRSLYKPQAVEALASIILNLVETNSATQQFERKVQS